MACPGRRNRVVHKTSRTEVKWTAHWRCWSTGRCVYVLSLCLGVSLALDAHRVVLAPWQFWPATSQNVEQSLFTSTGKAQLHYFDMLYNFLFVLSLQLVVGYNKSTTNRSNGVRLHQRYLYIRQNWMCYKQYTIFNYLQLIAIICAKCGKWYKILTHNVGQLSLLSPWVDKSSTSLIPYRASDRSAPIQTRQT